MTWAKGTKHIRHESLRILNEDLWHKLNEIWRKAKEGILPAQRSTIGHEAGLRHVLEVENNLSALIPDNWKGTVCSAIELYLLSAAACLHDIGKVIVTTEDHGHVSWEEIWNRPEDFGLEPDGESQAVAWLVRAHNDRRVDRLPYGSFVVKGSVTVNLPLLAALLCLADTLHCDSTRVSEQLIKMLGKEAENNLVTKFRRLVRGWNFDQNRKIAVQATARQLSDVDIYYEGFQGLKKEIEPVVPVLRDNGFPYELVPRLDDSGLKYLTVHRITEQRDLPGMDFYHEDDADIFKGRDDEIRQLYQTVLTSPITLLVGDSGVGKTSLICAGLFTHLKKLGTWQYLRSRIHDDPTRYVTSDICINLLEQRGSSSETIISVFGLLSDRFRSQRILVVFDQFEDILDVPLADKLEDLRQALQAVLAHRFDNLHILLVYRSDAQARLGSWIQRLSGSSSGLPTVYLSELDEFGGLEAVRALLSRKEIGYESLKLLKDILLDIKGQDKGLFPPFIQMVVTTLADVASESSPVITTDMYMELGGSLIIIGDYLFRRLDEFEECRPHVEQVLKAMTCSTGRKGEATVEELQWQTKLGYDALKLMLDSLTDKRMIRPLGGGRYEIIHDYFAQLVDSGLVSLEERRVKQLRELLTLKAAAYLATGIPLSTSEMAQLFLVRDTITLRQPEEILLLHSCLAGFGPAWYWFHAKERQECVSLLRQALASPLKVAKLRSLEILQANSALCSDDMPTLKDMLRNSDEDIRNAALFALAQVGCMDAMPALREKLKHWSREVREKAATALVELVSYDNQFSLLDMLKDSDDDVRGAVVRKIGRIGSRDDISTLREVLDDSARSVRIAAADAIVQLSNQQDLPIIREMLNDRLSSIREIGIAAIGRLGSRNDIPALRRMLADDDRDVRKEAVKVIGQLGSHDDLPSLKEMLTDSSEDMVEATESAIHQLVVRQGPSALKDMLKDSDRSVRFAAIEGLCQLASPQARTALFEILQDGDWVVRKAVVRAISQHGNPNDLPTLKKMLADSEWAVREEVVNVVGQHGSRDDVPTLKKMLTDNNEFVRKEAVKAISRLGSRDDVFALKRMLKDNGLFVRQAAIEAISQLDRSAFWTTLQGMIVDMDGVARRNVVKIVAQLDSPERLSMLREMLKDEDKYVRMEVVEAAGHLEHKEQLNFLAEIAGFSPFTEEGKDAARKLMRLDCHLYCPFRCD